MANPSAAHEPSMEEILASIRQIISEEGEAIPAARLDTPAPDKKESGEAKQSPAAPTSVADAASSQNTSGGSAPAMPQNSATPQKPEASSRPSASSSQSAPAAPTEQPRRSEVATAATPSRTPAEPARSKKGPEDRSIMSERSDSAVSGAFNALAHTILAQNARTLEDLVGEMLRPMLKEWLDDNLPSLVERLVREEIERVSRGRR
jgi:uncharacterized protein